MKVAAIILGVVVTLASLAYIIFGSWSGKPKSELPRPSVSATV